MSPISPALLVPCSESFQPTDVAGLQLWFDAASPATLTLQPGNKVSQWDSRGGSHYAANGTSTEQPVYTQNVQNGKPALVFNGSNRLRLPTYSHSVSNWTFILATNPAVATGTTRYWFSTQLGGAFFILAHLTGTNGQTGYYDTAWKDLAAAATGPQVLTFRLSSSTGGLLRRNGIVVGTAPTFTQESIGANAAIGGRDDTAGNMLTCSLFEWLLYDRSLSDSEVASNEQRLAAQWGIALT